METAVPISKSALLKTLKDLKEQPEEPKEDKEAKDLARLQNENGWEILKKRIEARIGKLQELSEAIEGAESVETIGFKFLASRVAIWHLRGVINDVEATAGYVAEQKGNGK